MSCAWNNYCIAIKHKTEAIDIMRRIGQELLETCNMPSIPMLADMLNETAMYFYMDGLVIERDNYITMQCQELKNNGDDWIFYLAQNIRDKNTFEWLKQRYELKGEPLLIPDKEAL
jgi:hypothetical protein